MQFQAGGHWARFVPMVLLLVVFIFVRPINGQIAAGSGRGCGQFLGFDLCVGLFDLGLLDQVILDFLGWTETKEYVVSYVLG
jgi:hypothetical protein